MSKDSSVTKVTILTSLYKASKYLDGFLSDIVDQTAFKQCRLFLMNGNSPEVEMEDSIIKGYMDRYANIQYVKLDSDPGIYGCWNKMIRESDSDYITNANVDDKLLPTCIEKHIALLDTHPDIDVAYCVNMISNSHDYSYKSITPESIIKQFPTNHFSVQGMLNGNLPHNHPVWRRSLHDRFGYFEEKKYVSGSDWDFWLRCTLGGVQMQLIPEILGIYFRNPEGMSSHPNNMQRNLREVKDIYNYYKQRISI